VSKFNNNIRKGDQFHLDGAHKNHLEVFDQRGHFVHVLNLDGTVNSVKTAKAAVQAALVYLRVYSMRLSVFFENIKDDTDLLLKNIDWSDIPDNYQVPEHYNFPNS